MAGHWRLLAMTAAACTLGAAAAAAQPAPPACVALRSELARLNAAAGPDPRYRAAIERQRYELARAQNMARSMHCGGGGFLFGPSPAPECPDVEDRIAAMQQNLRALAGQGGGMVDPRLAARRDDVLAALQQNGCTGGATQPAAAPRRRGLFDFLFGGGGGEQEAPPPNGPVTLPEQQAPPQSSTYRTVCVRLGDGFFYPISFATSRANFERDAAICQRTCPGTKAELFAYPNPGGSIADAVSVDGQPYKGLPNAFLYQKKYVAGLSCKPAGETWAQALAGADADLHRAGASAGARGAVDPPAAGRRGARNAARRAAPPVDDSGVADEAPPPGIGGPDDDVTSAPLAPLH
jgi:hypothetical protein